MKLSSSSRVALKKLEAIITEDPGNRAILPHLIPNALLSPTKLLHRNSKFCIISGFYIPPCKAPETDGPLGALVLANTLHSLGKQVCLMTDQRCAGVIKLGVDYLNAFYQSNNYSGLNFNTLDFEIFPSSSSLPPNEQYYKKILKQYRWDVLVSTERVGQASDGKCYNARGTDITEYTARLDLFLEWCHREARCATIAIGDGGNEAGMGNVVGTGDSVIGCFGRYKCNVKVDHLIVSGVSDWGCYGLCGGLYLFQGNYKAKDTVKDCFSRAQVHRILEVLVGGGAVDGLTHKSELSVDGFKWDTYVQWLDRIHDVLATEDRK